MKQSRSAFCMIIVVLFVCLLTGPARAGTVTVPLPEEAVALLSGSDGGARFQGENLQFLGHTGEPNLPYRVMKILLPPDAELETVSVSLENVVETSVGGLWNVEPVPPLATWDGEKVLEAWPEGRNIEDGRDADIYGADASYPEERTLPARTGEVRGWKVVDVPVALFRYNPVTRKLLRVTAAEVVVDYSVPVGKSAANGSFDSDIPDSVRHILVNYDEMASAYGKTSTTNRQAGESSLPGYLIVTTQAIWDASDSLDAFVTHKEALGFDVEVVSEDEWGGGTGDNAADNIRSWLADNYLALNAEYVLLIGNPHPTSGDVPMKMLWPMRNNSYYGDDYPESPSDLYYADLTGNWDLDGDGYYGEWDDDFGDGGVDMNWEVIVGRIPVYDAGDIDDLDSILSKTIRYATANPSTTEWRKNALLPMKPSDDNTPGYQLGEAIKDDVLEPLGYDGYVRVYDESYELDPPPSYTPCSVENVTTAWTEDNFGVVAWWTHGSDTVAWQVMDVNHAVSLDDAHPSMVFQCSCLNAYPEYDANLSYTLLKNGAVVTIGATRVSWYEIGQTEYAGSASNAGMTFRFSKNLLFHGMDAGTALASLKEETYAENEYFWMNFTDFNLFGDPSLGLDAPGSTPGTITVNIDGPDEARWLLNRTDSYAGGTSLSLVAGVVCEISFSDVDGWVKPSPYTVTVETDGVRTLNATYVKRTLDGPTFVKEGGEGDGSSWDSPKDLADALRDAMSGEEIWIAEGLYLPKYDTTNNLPLAGDEQSATFTLKSDVTLLGGFPDTLSGTSSDGRDPSLYRTVLTGDLEGDDETDSHGILTDVTGLNGGNANHVVSCYGISGSVIKGITITAGHADERDNTSAAGLNADHATVHFEDCGFIGNSATNAGGLGITDSEVEFEGCLFSGNKARYNGGGVYLRYSVVSLKDCSFSGNISGVNGGGLNTHYSTVTLEDCSFSNNETGEHGGGVCCYGNLDDEGPSALIRGCTFDGNVSDYRGGALDLDQLSPVVKNNTFSGNRAPYGAAIHSRCDGLDVMNSTFTDNDDNGDGETLKITFYGKGISLTNSIFWDESTHEIRFYEPGDTPVVSHCVIRGGTEAIRTFDPVSLDHVISDDPCLGPLTDNGGPTLTCALLPGSTALDAGTSVDAPDLDQRGVARPQPDGIDIGAFEARPGSLTVSFEGPDEGRWSLDGEGAYTSGTAADGLPVGTYSVAFSPVENWTIPSPAEVSVYEGATTDYRTAYGLDVDRPENWGGVEPGEGVMLTWDPFRFLEDPVTYEVYMLVDGVYVPVPKDQVNGTSVTLDLNGHTTYTLRVDADGFEGQPWTFTTANRAPVLSRRSPTDAADRLPVATELSWLYVDPDGDPVSYDLYFGAGADSMPEVLSSDESTTYSPALSADSEYAWRIVAFDDYGGILSSDVWTFSVTPDVSRITEPLSDDVLADCGINDLWVADVGTADLDALGEFLGRSVVPAKEIASLDVSPLSGDVTLEDLEESGSALEAVLPGGFHLDVTDSEGADLLAVPVSLSFTEQKVGPIMDEKKLLDQMHLFVLVGGQVYDLVALAGDERDTLFSVTSDVDDSGVTYFVDFRIYVTAGKSGKTLGAAAAEGPGLFTDTKDPAFIVESASSETGRFAVTLAAATVASPSSGGGCSAFGFGPGAALLVAGVFLVVRRR